MLGSALPGAGIAAGEAAPVLGAALPGAGGVAGSLGGTAAAGVPAVGQGMLSTIGQGVSKGAQMLQGGGGVESYIGKGPAAALKKIDPLGNAISQAVMPSNKPVPASAPGHALNLNALQPSLMQSSFTIGPDGTLQYVGGQNG